MKFKEGDRVYYKPSIRERVMVGTIRYIYHERSIGVDWDKDGLINGWREHELEKIRDGNEILKEMVWN